jgi:hypothetical protein
MIAAICLAIGVLVGYFAADKASQHALYCAHARGLWAGRNDREWEMQRLRNRVTHLESKARELVPLPQRNGVKR